MGIRLPSAKIQISTGPLNCRDQGWTLSTIRDIFKQSPPLGPMLGHMLGPKRVTMNLETTLPPLLEGGKWSPANISSGRKACPYWYQQLLESGPTVCEREIPTSHSHSCGGYKHTLQQWAHMRGAWSCSSHGAGAVQQLLSSLPTPRPLVPPWSARPLGSHAYAWLLRGDPVTIRSRLLILRWWGPGCCVGPGAETFSSMVPVSSP